MWIATFRPLHCSASSGDGVDRLRNRPFIVTINGVFVSEMSYCCLSFNRKFKEKDEYFQLQFTGEL